MKLNVKMIIGGLIVAFVVGGVTFSLFSDKVAIAASRVQYKAIPLKSGNSAQIEKTLNDMASQGWVYDSTISFVEANLIFKKN